jgi:hypothetical protein
MADNKKKAHKEIRNETDAEERRREEMEDDKEGEVPDAMPAQRTEEEQKQYGVVAVGEGKEGVPILRPDELPQKVESRGHYHGYPPLTPQEAEEKLGKETVAMVFPRPVAITLPDRSVVSYTAGIHQVPVELADHSYLAASGVTRLETPKQQELRSAQEGKEGHTAPPTEK